MYYSSSSLVIKSNDFKEADQLVTLFTRKHGKLKAIARGVKKPKSSLRACVQPFCHSQLFFAAGKELDIITQGRILEFYGNSREDYKRTLQCLYLLELLDYALLDRLPLPGLFDDLLKVLQLVNDHPGQKLALPWFEMNLLTTLGFKPELGVCKECGKEEVIFFDTEAGGMICQTCGCRETGKTRIVLSAESLSIARFLQHCSPDKTRRLKISAQAGQQLEKFLSSNLEYRLERRSRVKKMLGNIHGD